MRLGFRRTLQPHWSIESPTPDTIFWKLLISPSGILTGEERNVEEKTGSLFAIEVQTGRVLWRNVCTDEPWWFDSDRATADTLYVQSFRKPDLPEPKGITAINIRTGETRWQQLDFALLGTERDQVLVVRQGFSRREYFALEAATGEIIEKFDEEQPLIPEREELPETFFASPIRDIPEIISSAIRPNELRGSIDGLVHGIYKIYSIHLTKAEKKALSNELLIFNKHRLVFRETIHAETPLPLPENFFVSHDILLYVKEKRTLVGVDLRLAARA